MEKNFTHFPLHKNNCPETPSTECDKMTVFVNSPCAAGAPDENNFWKDDDRKPLSQTAPREGIRKSYQMSIKRQHQDLSHSTLLEE